MNKRAAVLGYGKSGKGAHDVLENLGYSVDIFDDKIYGFKKLRELEPVYTLISPTPGLEPESVHELINAKYKSGKLPQVVSEIDLAYSVMGSESKILAVTGTNGKSTVVHLTAQILNCAGIKAVACGNYGHPFSCAVMEHLCDTVFVLELSSFQTELLNNFAADAVAVLNLAPDHLDRYKTFEKYVEAKLKLLNFLKPDGVLLAEPHVSIANRSIKLINKVKFADSELTAWPRLIDGYTLDMGNYRADIRSFPLAGRHNLMNLVFALGLADTAAGFDGDITHLISGLKGMEHRMEPVSGLKGALWINDSKATNVYSTLVALKSYTDNVILLLGGRDKLSDYTPLIPEIHRCVKLLCLFGEASDVINSQIGGAVHVPVGVHKKLEDAVDFLVQNAVEGDVILLSPACTSYDEFTGFEDRGKKFASYIEQHSGKTGV